MTLIDGLVTNRLRLRLPELSDAEAIFHSYASDPAVTRYLVWHPHRDLTDTHEFLQRCLATIAKGDAISWVLERQVERGAIGMLTVRFRGPRVDFGYVLSRAHWGNGYMPEALGATIDTVFAQPDIYRAWATCDVENLASARVLEKVGMQREGLLRAWEVHPNIQAEPRDSFVYARVKAAV